MIGSRQKRIKFYILTAVVVVIFVYIFLLVLAHKLETATIYIPTKEVYNDITSYQLDEVYLDTSENDTVHVIEKVIDAPYIILFFHGNYGNVTECMQFLDLFEESGYSYALVDYPGYGKSTGRPSEKGLYASADALYDHAINDLGYRADQVIIYGLSLGGTVAVDLSSRVDEAALVVMSSFTSTHDVARERFSSVLMQPGMFLRNKYESINKINKVDAPVLLIHGDQDEILSIHNSERLYEAAVEPKQFHVVEGGGHAGQVDGIGVDQLLQMINELL